MKILGILLMAPLVILAIKFAGKDTMIDLLKFLVIGIAILSFLLGIGLILRPAL